MNQISKNHGFILVDVLIAVIIISVALISIVGVFIMIGKSNIVNDNEKLATTFARMQINYLKQYEGHHNSRLNKVWQEVCPDIYDHPYNPRIASSHSNIIHKYMVSSRVLKGLKYVDKNGHLINPDNYNGEEVKIDGSYIDAEIPDDILNDLNIIPVCITVSWAENINGKSQEKTLEIIEYYLGAPTI